MIWFLAEKNLYFVALYLGHIDSTFTFWVLLFLGFVGLSHFHFPIYKGRPMMIVLASYGTEWKFKNVGASWSLLARLLFGWVIYIAIVIHSASE